MMFFLILIFIVFSSIFLYGSYIQLYSRSIARIRNSAEHSNNLTPRGGGVVFGIISLIIIFIIYNNRIIDLNLFLPLFFVSFGCLVLGFLDDLFHLKIFFKFFNEFLISVFILVIFKENLENYLPYFHVYFIYVFFCIFFIWFINAANFLDGSDGHLSVLVILQNLMLLLAQVFTELTNLYIYNIILIISLIIFYWFNRHPAKLYMGDAGSLFLGGVQLVLLLIFLFIFKFDIFILLIIFSYFMLETSGTLFLRLLYKKEIFKRHKGHSYQKFVEIYGHNKMIKLLIFFYIFWISPLILLCVFYPSISLLLCIISFFPPLFFLLKYGLPVAKM